jgi:conjugative relaxase-like TrwC/TraI family protein
MATINGMGNMKNIAYHEEQAAYNMRNLANEIQKEFSLGADEKIDLNDPRYKEFTEHNPYVSRWYGGMAKELGVEGQIVTLESFKNVNLGYTPNSNLNDNPRALNSNPAKLGKNGIPLPAGKQSKKRNASIEMLFTQPKSLSIAFSVMSKQDEIALKKKLNDILINHIVPAIEEDAILRKGANGAHKQKGSGLLFTWFNHTENRGVADDDGNVKIEPHDHIHFDIINSVMDENGELYSLFNTMIFANKMKYESIWQLELIKVLQEFGFELEQTHLKEEQNNPFIPDSEKVVHAFEVAGIPEEIVQYSLKRSLEIAQEVEKQKQDLSNSSTLRNSNSSFLCELNESNSSLCAEMTEIARKETRHKKTELSPSEIKAIIQAEVKEKFNFDLSDIERIRTYKQNGINQKHKVPTEEQLMEGLHRQYKTVDVTEEQFRAYIIKQTALYLSKDECAQLATKIFLNQSKMILDKEQYVYYEKLIKNDPSLSDYDKEQLRFQFDRDVRFTSNYMLNLDRSIIEGFEQRIHEEKFVFPHQFSQAKIREFEVWKGFNFSTDQRNAIEMCLTNKGAIVNIAGRAGSGKSTLLECVKEKYQEGGFNVWGTSVSSTATDGLQQSTNLDKDKCFNTSELLFKLKEGKISFNEKTVLIIDEAGFIDSLTMRKLSQAINAAGGKIIACGESQQLQAIGVWNLLHH